MCPLEAFMSHPHVCCRGRFRSSGADPHPSAVVSTCRLPAAGCGHRWWVKGRRRTARTRIVLRAATGMATDPILRNPPRPG